MRYCQFDNPVIIDFLSIATNNLATRLCSDWVKRFCILILCTFALLGCCTRQWNAHINDQYDISSRTVEGTPSERFTSDAFGIYDVGLYVGMKELKGESYHYYLFANTIDDTKNDVLEIMIPQSGSKNKPILRTTNHYSINKSDMHATHPAYIRYGNSDKNTLRLFMNPKFIDLRQSLEKDMPHKRAFPTEYPSLLDINILGKENMTVQYGQRLNPHKTRLDDLAELESNQYVNVFVCPDTPSYPDLRGYFRSQQNARNCDVWSWSDVKKAEYQKEYIRRKVLEAERYLGYLLTIPADVLTFPFQVALDYFNDNADQ